MEKPAIAIRGLILRLDAENPLFTNTDQFDAKQSRTIISALRNGTKLVYRFKKRPGDISEDVYVNTNNIEQALLLLNKAYAALWRAS